MERDENVTTMYCLQPTSNPQQVPTAEFSEGNPVRTNKMEHGLDSNIFSLPMCLIFIDSTLTLFLIGGVLILFAIQLEFIGCYFFLIPLYAIYLFLTFRNYEFSKIRHIQKAQNFEKDFLFIKNAPGQIVLQAESYHQMERGQNKQKVVTSSETARLLIFENKDQSQPIEPLSGEPKLTIVRYFIDYQFIDHMSEMKFRLNQQGIKMRNSDDAHQSYDAFYDFPGRFQAKIYHTGQMTWKYNVGLYVFCILGLTLPYVCCLDLSIKQLDVRIKKSVRI